MNYWADPHVVRKLVPAPFEVATRDGLAVVGLCLLRLEGLRPEGFPARIGLATENMAHRIAVRFRQDGCWRDGVFVPRRETDSPLIARVGGRLFPGVHALARFAVCEERNRMAISVASPDGAADVSVCVRSAVEWKETRLFRSLCDVSAFFRVRDCGFSPARRTGEFEGVRLCAHAWAVRPLAVLSAASALYDNPVIFPAGSIGLDGAVLMQDITHHWEILPSLHHRERERVAA